MARPWKVRVSGPLEEFAPGFTAELAELGYAPKTVEAQLQLMNHLSAWLGVQGLAAGDLDAEVVGRFVVERRRRYSFLRSERALATLLGFLRERGSAPTPPPVAPTCPVDVVSEAFARYLSTHRGLAAATVASYVLQVRPFLAWYEAGHGSRWEALTAAQVRRYLEVRAAGQRPRSVQVGCTALRALLRWMWREGMVPDPLAGVVDSVAARGAAGLPRPLAPGQVRELLAGLSADGLAAVRDEAMVALMWRMGLRAGEVAALRLDDIDWRAGVLAVRGKGDRWERLPLPADVGGLVANYLQAARPAPSPHRQVFLALDAPHRPMKASAVSSVVARAAARAGIPGGCAAHRLRHIFSA